MSSIGNQRDRLVQWCHGAPGAIHLYVLAYKVRGCLENWNICQQFCIQYYINELLYNVFLFHIETQLRLTLK